MNVSNLRKYRIDFEQFPIYNDNSQGIALFDLIASFIGAFLIDVFFGVSKFVMPFCKNKQLIYYLLVIPIGIVIHHIFAHIKSEKPLLFPQEITFLNKKLFSFDFNVYKVLIVGLIFAIVRSCRI